MLAHCVNESCNRPVHAFSEGRLFQFEIVSISLAATDESATPFDEKPQRETVHFWLCGSCASSYTLVLEPARGLRLVANEEHASSLQESARVSPEMLDMKRC
jgi:hypothetical protein